MGETPIPPLKAGAGASVSAAEYVTDVAYLRNFVEDLAPARLRLATALNGFPAPAAREFAYCELGAGNGDTLATLAAANPDASFVGLDINAEHVAFAEGLAKRGGLDNVRFLERDFSDVAADDLGRFDYVGAHGVLSWVSAEKRLALIDFASRHLEPGGLLTVSYNTLPGWAAIGPLRRLMVDASSGVAGSTIDRARHGIKVARLVADAKAAFFEQNPTARSMLDQMETGGLPYVAHEYFHSHWNPMYFTDVAAEMAAADLYYVGQLPLYLNFKDLWIPPSLEPLFAGITDRIVLERMKDYAINEFFRRDVYVKGRVTYAPANTHAYFDETPFGAPAGTIKREVKLPHYTLGLAGELFEAVAPSLLGGAATVPELARLPELAHHGAAKIRDVVLRLALADQIVPMTRSMAPVSVSGAAERRYRAPLAYNRMVLEQRLSRDNPVVLASPLSGSGLTLSLLHAACLHMMTAMDPSARPAWIERFMTERVTKLADGTRQVESREEQAALLAKELAQFAARRVPELVALGILEQDS